MSGPFVLDASAAIAWASPDEQPSAALSEAVASGAAVAPALWPYEVHNVLLVLRRRGRLTDDDWALCSDALRVLPVEIEPPDRAGIQDAVTELAHAQNLTVYDAAYLELARRRGLALATLDEVLRKAARRLRIGLI